MAKLGLVNTSNTDVSITGDPGVLAALGLVDTTMVAGAVHTLNYTSGLPLGLPTVLKSTESFPISKEGEVILGEFNLVINDFNIRMKNPRYSEVPRYITDTIYNFDKHSSIVVRWDIEKHNMRLLIIEADGNEIVASDTGQDTLLDKLGFAYNHPHEDYATTVWANPTRQTNDKVIVLNSAGGTVYEDITVESDGIHITAPHALTKPTPSIITFGDNDNFTYSEFALRFTININTPEEYTEFINFDNPRSLDDVADLINNSLLGQNGIAAISSAGVLQIINKSGGLFKIQDELYNGISNPVLKNLVPGAKSSLLNTGICTKFSGKDTLAKPGLAYIMTGTVPIIVSYNYLNYKSTSRFMGASTTFDDIDETSSANGVIRNFRIERSGSSTAGKYNHVTKIVHNVSSNTFVLDTPVDDPDTLEVMISAPGTKLPSLVDVSSNFITLSGITNKPNASDPSSINTSITKPYIDYIGSRLEDMSCHIQSSNIVRTTIPEEDYVVYTNEVILHDPSKYTDVDITILCNKKHYSLSFDNSEVSIYTQIIPGASVSFSYSMASDTILPIIEGGSKIIPISTAQVLQLDSTTLSDCDNGNYTQLLDSNNALAAMVAANTFEYFDK